MIPKKGNVMDENKLLPDFDEMSECAAQLAETKAHLIILKNAIREKEAECIHEVLTNKDFWLGVKPPSMQYCTTVVKVLGNTEKDKIELVELRSNLATLIELEELRARRIQSMRDQLDLFRTLSANTRRGHLSHD